VHCDEVSPNVPFVRMIPPSDASKIWVGFDGFTTSSCWSGWIEFGEIKHDEKPRSAHQLACSFCVSKVRSVNVRLFFVASGSPAVSE
jgi:hypothetical protein